MVGILLHGLDPGSFLVRCMVHTLSWIKVIFITMIRGGNQTLEYFITKKQYLVKGAQLWGSVSIAFNNGGGDAVCLAAI